MLSHRVIFNSVRVKVALAVVYCLFLSGRANATQKRVCLRFGVVSDIHVSVADNGTSAKADGLDAFLEALRYFDRSKVDAVVVAGDMANAGRVVELLAVGKVWDSVFPDGKGADGRPVEKVFVYGNHDPARWPRVNTHGERLIADDLAAAWEQAFHEPFEPVYVKSVRGYDFVGVHWGNEAKAAAKIDEVGRKGKVFFHVQHPHVKGTVYGGHVWGQDDGASFVALAKYPAAVSFSGHSHTPLSNEQSIWQGEFTALGTASLRYLSVSSYRNTQFPRGYENGRANKRTVALSDADDMKLMVNENNQTNRREGYLVSVYADEIVFARREFISGMPVGEDWVMPLDGSRPFALSARLAKGVAPEFQDGAKLTVKKTEAYPRKGRKDKKIPAWKLEFSEAKGAYEYEITGTGADDRPVVSWVIAPVKSVLLAADRFASEDVRFSVVPVDSLGRCGRALGMEPVSCGDKNVLR